MLEASPVGKKAFNLEASTPGCGEVQPSGRPFRTRASPPNTHCHDVSSKRKETCRPEKYSAAGTLKNFIFARLLLTAFNESQ